MPGDLDALARRFSFGAQEFVSSPLYRRLCQATAADPELLAIAAQCRAGQQPTNLFLAAVHFLLLGGASPALAAFYPSVAGAAARNPDGVEPMFRSFCLAHREALAALVSTRLVQTNVVARSAALRLGLAVVARRSERPVTLLEVGCSAGVHLCFDRFEYRIAGRSWGASGSPVQISSEWRGEAPPPDQDRLPALAGRLGVDLNPVDARDPEARRWLRALVWPENG
ncbi:MAG TPA: DUF2332 domain-containing protein, partial [Dehalococcoidia bacterium]|nr:DUF2332 domain-containing protein [Dehalococcoidia bacterium]